MKQVICTFSVQVSLLYVWQAVKQLLELPLNLTIVSPAHTPNWDLVSDVVNSCSRIYRSPKQCRNRYENVIIPREEGKVMGTVSLYFVVNMAYSPCLSQTTFLTFFSWCMKPTPRRKLRAYTRYPTLVCVCDECSFAVYWCCWIPGLILFHVCVQSKNSRPLRTCQIYTQDDNATHIQLYNSRFELMKIIASKRSPPIKPL